MQQQKQSCKSENQVPLSQRAGFLLFWLTKCLFSHLLRPPFKSEKEK
jgi:hypothetical protein